MMKLILSLFITTLILSGCTFGQGKIGGPTRDDIWQKTETLSIEEDLANTSKKIKDEPEFQNCIKQQVNVCRQSAGIQIAQKLKDPIFCKELSSIEQQTARNEALRTSLADLKAQKVSLMATHQAKVAALTEQVAKETSALKAIEDPSARVKQQTAAVTAESKAIQARIEGLKATNPYTDTQYIRSTGGFLI